MVDASSAVSYTSLCATAIPAGLVVTEMSKGILDRIDPTTELHDTAVQLYALAVTLVLEGLATWAFFGAVTGPQIVLTVIQAIIAVAGQFGIYRRVNPIPRTPTMAYISRAAAMADAVPRVRYGAMVGATGNVTTRPAPATAPPPDGPGVVPPPSPSS